LFRRVEPGTAAWTAATSNDNTADGEVQVTVLKKWEGRYWSGLEDVDSIAHQVTPAS
jgi:hypothetical protein